MLMLGASAAIATAGIIAMRRRLSPSAKLDRLLNYNLRLFSSPSHRQTLTSIAGNSNRAYLLRGWPRPGINDAAKRTLIALAASPAAADLETARLAVLEAPLAEKRPHTLETHGDVRIDEFYWLRDDDRKDAAVLAHLNAENAYTKAVLSNTEALQESLYKEMRGRIQEADQSAPQIYQGYWYYTRTEEGAQYAIHCRRAISAATATAVASEMDVMDESMPEEILLDENEDAKGHEFYMVGGFDVSPDHRLLAYGVDTKGGEQYELRVKEIATGKSLLAKPIPDTAGSFAWAADNKTLFYVTKDKLDRPEKVWRHTLTDDDDNDSSASEPDALVFHEKDEAFYVGIHSSRSEKYLYIHSGSAVTSDVRYISADDPTGDWKIVLPRSEDVEYSVDDRGDQFFITLRDAARPNSTLLVAPIADPTATAVLLPHREDVKLEHIELSQDWLVALERENGLQQAVVHQLPVDLQPVAAVELTGGAPIGFEEPAYELSCGSQGDFTSPILRFQYTSLTTPDTGVDFNMVNGRRATKKVQPVLGGFDRSKYKTERVWATAPDGMQVPVSLVYRTDLCKRDGSDPMLLNAYGSYEISNDADFRSTRLSLIDRGFVFAIAHVRGGGDLGRRW